MTARYLHIKPFGNLQELFLRAAQPVIFMKEMQRNP